MSAFAPKATSTVSSDSGCSASSGTRSGLAGVMRAIVTPGARGVAERRGATQPRTARTQPGTSARTQLGTAARTVHAVAVAVKWPAGRQELGASRAQGGSAVRDSPATYSLAGPTLSVKGSHRVLEPRHRDPDRQAGGGRLEQARSQAQLGQVALAATREIGFARCAGIEVVDRAPER